MQTWKEKTQTPRQGRGIEGRERVTGMSTATRSWKTQEGFSPRAFGGSTALPTPWVQSSHLQNWERINFSCVKPQNLCCFVMAALGGIISLSLIGWLWELDELTCIRCLEQWLLNSEHWNHLKFYPWLDCTGSSRAGGKDSSSSEMFQIKMAFWKLGRWGTRTGKSDQVPYVFPWCPKLLTTASQQSLAKKSILLTSAQVFRDEY